VCFSILHVLQQHLRSVKSCVLQCVAVCCSELQCVAVYCMCCSSICELSMDAAQCIYVYHIYESVGVGFGVWGGFWSAVLDLCLGVGLGVIVEMKFIAYVSDT